LIKKIKEKDKEDWENFLNNKKKNLNKDPVKKKKILMKKHKRIF